MTADLALQAPLGGAFSAPPHEAAAETMQERYLRSLRMRLFAVSIAFVLVLAHNRILLAGERFVYVQLVLLNLLDTSFFYYLTYRGFLVEFLSYLRLVIDTFAITVLCHLTGSVTSVTPMTYVLLLCVVAVITDRRHTLFCAGCATAWYVGLLALEYKGILAYAVLAPAFRIVPAQKPLAIWSNALFIPALLVLSAFLVSGLASRIRRREESLRRANEDLSRATTGLVEAQGRLARTEKLASLGTLVAGVAHELNNPIGFIQQNLDTLESYAGRLSRAAEASPEEREKLARELRLDVIREELPALLSDCKDGARRCRDIVDNLKDFSRPALSRSREELLEGLAEKALRFVSHQVPKDATVIRAFALNTPILCYPGPLTQVLTNLLSNAAQSLTGPGEIRIETGARGTEEIFVRISDTGRGIAPEDLSRIFDPFFTTKEPGAGMGLGLSISYGIVQEHGGRIEAGSEPGKGSSFTVVLPRRLPERAAPGARP